MKIVFMVIFNLLMFGLSYLFIKKSRNKFIIIAFAFILGISIFIPTYEILFPIYKNSEIQIIITPTGIKGDDKALSNTISVKNVIIDGMYYKPEDIFTFNDLYWEKRNETDLVWKGNSIDSITAKVNYKKEVYIEFITNKWCGIGDIKFGENFERLNLYSDEENVESFQLEERGRGTSYNIKYFVKLIEYLLILVCISAIFICLFIKNKKFNGAKYDKKFNILLICITNITCIGILVFLIGIINIKWFLILYIALFILLKRFFTILVENQKKFLKVFETVLKDYRIYITFILALIIIIPCIEIIYNDNVKTESYNSSEVDVSVSNFITEKTKISQKININGKYKKLNIKFLKNNFEDGLINIILKQGKNEYCEDVSTDFISNDEFYEVDISKLKSGEIELIICGTDSIGNSLISLPLTKETLFGQLKIDGINIDKNLILNLETKFFTNTFFVRCFLFIILVLLFIVAVRCIYNKNFKSRSSIFYMLSIIILITVWCIKFPLHTYIAQPFEEAASSSFQLTFEKGLWGSIMLDDGVGYWPLFQRLIAMFVIYILRQTKYAFLCMQIISISFLALICSQFCLKFYKNYLEDEFRFLICIIFGTLIIRQGTLMYTNFCYWGILLIILNFMIDLKNISCKTYMLIIFTPLVVISKAHYLVLVPIAILIILILILMNKSKEEVRLIIYSIIVLILSSIQGVYTYINRANWGSINPLSIENIVSVSKKGIYHFLQGIISIFIDRNIYYDGFVFNLIALIILILVIAICIYNFKEKSNYRESFLILGLLLLGYGSNVLNCLAIGNFTLGSFRNEVNWGISIGLKFNRQTFFTYICVIMVMFVLISVCYNKYKNFIIVFALAFISIQFLLDGTSTSVIPEYSRADWYNHYKMIYNDSYAIPICPETSNERFILKNSEVLHVGNSEIFNGYYNNIYGSKTVKKIEANQPINTFYLDDIENFQQQEIISIYINKLGITQSNDINLVAIDKNNNIILKKKPDNVNKKSYLSFSLESAVRNVSKVKFVDSNGMDMYVKPDIFFAIKKY